jgi:AcrR family transcriptional regulator
MQIKKDFTREQIVTAAKRVFLKRGFAKASMRDIAKGAGIGLSNIYNYYKSKDEIFRQIVAPLIARMQEMVNEHHSVNYHEQFLKYASGESDEMLTEHVQKYLQLISHYHDELELILFKAQGSSLENFIDDYTDVCTNQVLTFMDGFKQKYPIYATVSSTFTYHVHTVWMFSFMSEVIKHKLSAKEIEKAIEDYIQFEYSGWRALMNKHQTL